MTDLMQQYQALSDVVEFNPETFAQQWRELAQQFDIAGRPSMAATCLDRARWYEEAGTGYVQKFLYHEITSVPADYIRSDKDERMLPCIVCDTWTKHVRVTEGWWTCGCGELVEEHVNVRNP